MRTLLAKAAAFAMFVGAALVIAGVYGSLHDQISYTVSPEYFTRFKFYQFGLLDNSIPERVRAAEVGFLAAWWMGLPIGLLTGVAGFIQRTPALMRRALLWSLLVILSVAFASAMLGLLYGVIRTRSIDLAGYRGWYIPDHVVHIRRYLCAGYMHNASYLGGTLAIPITWGFHFMFRARSQSGGFRQYGEN
jgi:hypothetical protein